MMIINENERKFLLDEMKKLLKEYDYTYTEIALNKIIDKWAEEKKNLIEAFKKHPKYLDGKFMIVFENEYKRDVDTVAVDNFSYWLTTSKSLPLVKDYLPEDIVAKREAWCTYLPDDLYNFLRRLNQHGAGTKCLSVDTADKINSLVPSMKAKKCEKTSRVINRLLTYIGYAHHPDYNREYAKYADAINPLTQKRHFILSLNPLDYLTMSFGNSWSSCHTIDKQNKRRMENGYHGMYSSGTMSYMLDGTSIVTYVVDEKYKGTEFWTQPKVNRQMFHYGKGRLIQSRLYPQNSESDEYTPYRNIVQEAIAMITEQPNLWTVKRGTEWTGTRNVNSKGTHYRDYTHFNSCTLSVMKGYDPYPSIADKITVGARPICVNCGYEHEESESIQCCDQEEPTYCAACGSRIDGEIIWIDGEPYCRNCVHYCEECDSYTTQNTTYISDEFIDVCPDCLDNYFTQCNECGEWFRNDDVSTGPDGHSYCGECYDELFEDDEEESVVDEEFSF